MRLRQRATKDREVLAVNEDQASVDHAVASDHTIAGDLVVFHAEVGAAVLDEHIPLFKSAFIKQHLEPFTRRQLAFGVLGLDALGTATQTGGCALVFELFKNVLHGLVSLLRGKNYGGGAA